MGYQKSKLIELARKVQKDEPLSPQEIEYLTLFEKKTEQKKIYTVLKRIAVPMSLGLGFFYQAFPKQFGEFVTHLPQWTNFSPPLLTGVDYLWDLVGEPVRHANIMYHLPNVVLYSFGIFGIKKLFDAIDKRNWLDRVLSSQATLNGRIASGNANLSMKKGHSILFTGKGDFIGMQFVLNHDPDDAVTVTETAPTYSSIWNRYMSDALYDDLKKVLVRTGGENAGEYIFFPVKDDKIFLPPPTAYDLSPHKLDIICQNIRTIERENGWRAKRIIIVGDRFHKSYVRSEDKKGPLKNTEDTISLESISKKYKKVTLLDPTDIVLKRIIEIADGRRIVFRATREGMKEYKMRFYSRLEKTGYKPKKTKKGILTIGYDLFEDLTEQQMLARKIDDYYPVVLSKSVHDALVRNGYKKSEFIYVPELVLRTTSKTASEQ